MINITQVLVPWLQAKFPNITVGTRTPADWTGRLPFVKVAAVSGGRPFVLGGHLVDISVFASNPASGYGDTSAMNLISDVGDALTRQCRGISGPGVVTKIGVRSLPALRPYTNDAVVCYGSMFVVFCRAVSEAS